MSVKISIVGSDKVVRGYNKINKSLNGPVYDDAAKEMEKDIEKSGKGWKGSGRVKAAVKTKQDKEGIEIKFISTSAKHSLEPLGEVFVKVIETNIDKYIKEIEDEIGEAFDG